MGKQVVVRLFELYRTNREVQWYLAVSLQSNYWQVIGNIADSRKTEGVKQ